MKSLAASLRLRSVAAAATVVSASRSHHCTGRLGSSTADSHALFGAAAHRSRLGVVTQLRSFHASSLILQQSATVSGGSVDDSLATTIVTAAMGKMEKLGGLEALQRHAEVSAATNAASSSAASPLSGAKAVAVSMVFMSLPKEVRHNLATVYNTMNSGGGGGTTAAAPTNDQLQRLLAKLIVASSLSHPSGGSSSGSIAASLMVETKQAPNVGLADASAVDAAAATGDLLVRWVVDTSKSKSSSSSAAEAKKTAASAASTPNKVAAAARSNTTANAAASGASAASSSSQQPVPNKPADVLLVEKLVTMPEILSLVTPETLFRALAHLFPDYPTPGADVASVYGRAVQTLCFVELPNPFYKITTTNHSTTAGGGGGGGGGASAAHRKNSQHISSNAESDEAAAAALQQIMSTSEEVKHIVNEGLASMSHSDQLRQRSVLRLQLSMKHLVKHHGRFLDVLRMLEPYGLFVSENGLKAVRATLADTVTLERSSSAHGVTNSPFPAQASSASRSALRDILEPVMTPDQLQTRARFEQKVLVSAAPSGWELEDISKIYQPEALPGDGLPPPQPADFLNMAASSGQRTSKNVIRDGGNEYTGVFTPQMLVPIIPTYFVPIELVVSQLAEGYTVEHIESIFMPTGTLEAITLSGQRFVRMHGGRRSVELMRRGKLGNTYTANETVKEYLEYKPDVRFAQHIVSAMKRCGVKPWRWVPLRAVLTEMADPTIVAQMKFQKYQSLVYFSQMQHYFGFSTAGEGELCWIGDISAANLTYERSPIPSVVNELVGVLTAHNSVALETLIDNASSGDPTEMFSDVSSSLGGNGADALDILQSMHGLSPYSRDLLLEYYDGNMKNFFLSHKDIFTIDEETNQVQLTNFKRIKTDKGRSLEERLEDAMAERDRKTARKIRRKMARARNPDNPLFDSARFAEELAKFLPRNRHITLRAFMKNLPPEIYDLFPAQHLNPFRNHPHLFKLFEFREPGKLYVCRPDVPLPEGHLRLKYTEAEIIQLTASVLQAAGNRPMSIFTTFGRLPFFAREHVRTVNKGLFELLKNYPQYFLVVFRESVRMDARSAHVSLVGMPPTVMDDSPLWEGAGGGGESGSNQRNNKSGGGGDDDDAFMSEALAEVRASIQQAGYAANTSGNNGMQDFDMDD